MAADLDRIDLGLLHLLQGDARAPMETTAHSVGLSVAACYKRVQRLREVGHIVKEAAVVRPKTMGWNLTMLVLVTLEREKSEIIDGFIKTVRATPEIVAGYYVAGDYDFVLKIVARDMEEYESFTRRVLYADQHVKTFKTLVVMREFKEQSPIPPA